MDNFDRFLYEDLDDEGDVTSNALFDKERGTAVLFVKESCIIAGLTEAENVFMKTGAGLSMLYHDGEKVQKNTKIATISGPIRSILSAERLSLNFLGRMSAIATTTHTLVERCKKINPNLTIAATRKTTPGFRLYEKKAVQIGGGEAHRFGLYDAVMIKDNHIKAVGSIEKAIKRVLSRVKNKTIEVEVDTPKDAQIAAGYPVDVIMLDNFSAQDAKVTAELIRKKNPNIIIEISGGITPKNITDFAAYADRISLGYLTHTVINKDFSLEIM